MVIMIRVIMACAWLLVVGCAANLLSEKIADTLDNQANMIASR